jgi:N-acetylglucosamine kinase-like BadF-type ATPase
VLNGNAEGDSMSKWFLGVDGGQSSTVALIGDETGCVVGVGRAGPCNHVSHEESRTKYREAIGGAVDAALKSAKLTQIRFEAACLGLSGGPGDKDALTREIVQASRYIFTHDAHVALIGAAGGKPGVIVIAGTGSIAYGKNAAGKTARAGGWGYIFGDEGSAFDLVRQALRAALRHEEGWGPETALRRHLLRNTGAASINEVLHLFYTPDYPRAKVAAMAPLVDEAANAGDAVARDILGDAARSLAALAEAVETQLYPGEEYGNIYYSGGVFKSALLLERFQAVMEMGGLRKVAPPLYPPAAGALMEAWATSNVHATPQHLPSNI